MTDQLDEELKPVIDKFYKKPKPRKGSFIYQVARAVAKKYMPRIDEEAKLKLWNEIDIVLHKYLHRDGLYTEGDFIQTIINLICQSAQSVQSVNPRVYEIIDELRETLDKLEKSTNL